MKKSNVISINEIKFFVKLSYSEFHRLFLFLLFMIQSFSIFIK